MWGKRKEDIYLSIYIYSFHFFGGELLSRMRREVEKSKHRSRMHNGVLWVVRSPVVVVNALSLFYQNFPLFFFSIILLGLSE